MKQNNILAICTAFSKALIALEINGEKSFFDMDCSAKHSESLLFEIDKLLKTHKISEIDSFAVVVGPGSFTGIRIGVSLVLGICAANENAKTISISSLDFMAKEYLKTNGSESDFYVCLDALSDKCYITKYNKLGEKLEEERLMEISGLDDLLLPIVGLSDEDLANEAVVLTPETLLSLALDVKPNKSLTELRPRYIRLSQAEDNLRGKNGNN